MLKKKNTAALIGALLVLAVLAAVPASGQQNVEKQLAAASSGIRELEKANQRLERQAAQLSAELVAERPNTRLLVPSAESKTAMTNCPGVSLEGVKAAHNLSVPYVFDGNEELKSMQFCFGGHERFDNGRSYRVPAGTRGWAQANGALVLLEGCINLATCLTCKPPAPTPPTGKVHIVKKTYDTEAQLMRTPTGAFDISIGDHQVILDANGEGEVELPAGKYTIAEKFDPAVWEQVYISAAEITVEAGKTVNIEIKNRQRRPEPAPQPLPPPKERKPRPVTPEQPAEEPECPTCASIMSSYGFEELGPKSPAIEVWPEIEGGRVVSGVWMFNGRVVSEQVRATLDPRKLYKAVGGKAGTYFLQFVGKDEDGHVVACGTRGTELVLVSRGRHWFWKLPAIHCLYAYTKGITDWSTAGTLEKLLVCPAEAALAWWLWPVEGIHKKAACVLTMLPNGGFSTFCP